MDASDESPPPAISASPLDLSHATPELWAALAKAQAAVKSVGKDGYNKDKSYAYTTADTMIAAAGKARAAAGGELAVVTAWEQEEIDPPPTAGTKDGPGQWPVSLVRLHFAIGHAGGGYIRGTASCHAIGSRARPPDKAVAAALTYAEGFVERGLMRLDRDESVRAGDAADDVDSRSEPDHTASAPAKSTAKREEPSFRKPAEDKPAAKATTKAAAKPAAAKDTKAKTDLPADPLRDAVKARYADLGGKAWRPWSDVLKAAELLAHACPDNADKTLLFGGALTKRHLQHIDAYLIGESEAKARAEAIAKEQAEKPGHGNAAKAGEIATREREPGEDDEDDEDSGPSIGDDLATSGEPDDWDAANEAEQGV